MLKTPAWVKDGLPTNFKQWLVSVRAQLFNTFSCVSIETTSACNRRCAWCPNSLSERSLPENEKRMERALFRKIVDELAAHQWVGQLMPHFYNEPLLDERLEEFMAYAHARLPACFLRIVSNGDMLTVDRYRALAAAGVGEFVVSRYDAQDSAAVVTLKRYRAEHKDKVRVIYKTLERITTRGGLIKVEKDIIKKKTCFYPSWNIIIDYKGDVIFCCDDYFHTIKLGNVREESLLSIWNSPRHKKLRTDVAHGVFDCAICAQCWGGKNPFY